MQNTKPSASSRAMAYAVVGVGYAVIGIVVLFFDVMTIKLLWSRFPDGLFRYAAVAGVLATGITIIALVVGKSHWFRPGGQMNWAWVMTGVELAISIVNVIAAFNPDGMVWWVLVMPATPVMAVVTWILMIFFSPERAQLHAQMEMQDEKAKAELEYAKAEHEAHMTVKHEFLKAYQGFLREEATAQPNLDKLKEGARKMSQQVISGIIGSPIGIPESRIVDSTLQAPAQLAQTAEVPSSDKVKTDVPQLSESEIPLTMNKVLEALGIKREEKPARPLPVAPQSNQNGNGASSNGRQ